MVEGARVISRCARRSVEAVQDFVNAAKPEAETVRVPEESGTFSKMNPPDESVITLAEYDLLLS